MLMKHNLTINLNEDWDPLPEISGSLLGTLLIVNAVLGLFIAILCYIYITYILHVNEINKLLLTLYVRELILCFCTVIIGHMILPFFQNIWTCSLSLTPTVVLYSMAANATMCISGIRYYTKLKAEQSQVVDPKHVITFIKCNKIFSYFVCMLVNILSFWFGIEVEFVVCLINKLAIGTLGYFVD